MNYLSKDELVKMRRNLIGCLEVNEAALEKALADEGKDEVLNPTILYKRPERRLIRWLREYDIDPIALIIMYNEQN